MAKIKTRSKSKLGLLIGILILSVALIFGTKLVKQNQENRSKAAACVPKEGVNSLKFDTSCGKDSYRYMTFSCYDGFGRREGGLKSCRTSSTWKAYAEKYCKGHFSKCDTKTVNGLCDTEFMKCKKGTPEEMEGPKYVAPLNKNITPPTPKVYWRCKGINNGKNDSCSKFKEAPVTPTPSGKVDGICDPGQKRCNGERQLQTCNSTGSAWNDTNCGELRCNPKTLSCNETYSVTTTCHPETKSCSSDGKISKICDISGTKITYRACRFGCSEIIGCKPEVFLPPKR